MEGVLVEDVDAAGHFDGKVGRSDMHVWRFARDPVSAVATCQSGYMVWSYVQYAHLPKSVNYEDETTTMAFKA